MSVGVVVAGFVMLLTGWLWLDPAVSLVINAVIIWGTWGPSRKRHDVPEGRSFTNRIAEVGAFISKASGVQEIHDLHIWSMSTTETALTAHLLMPGGHPGDSIPG